jgi:DNA helicase HerA-like ATPase
VSSTPEKEAGIIVGEASSTEFLFASKTEDYPSKWEYIVVYSNEQIDGKLVEVPVVAQVERIVSASQALSANEDVDALRRIISAEIQDVHTWGRAKVLGYQTNANSRILQPRHAVTPGKPIYIASKELLAKFYSFPEKNGLHIGSLITRSDVPVQLSVEGFRRHLAIIAQTGAGKSYCAGVLIEELLKKGATIVVIDPHADYALLSLTQDDSLFEQSYSVTVFRNPASTSRYGNKNVGEVRPYEIAFTDLEPMEVCDVAHVPQGATNIREAVRLAIASLGDRQYTTDDLLNALENPVWVPVDEKGKQDRTILNGAASASKYIRSLSKLKVFTVSSTKVNELLKPMHVSVIDLSGLEDKAMNYICSRVLENIYDIVANDEYEFPVFIMIEEAHKFVPPETSTYASAAINKIASEGRKFGVFLTLITQRPSKVDSDSLSQCNSQIVMKMTNPEDQRAIQSSSERMSSDLLADLPGLNPGECVIVGEVTRAPVMVKVRPRVTKEGGVDIDVISKLEEARRKVKGDELLDKQDAMRQPFTGRLT